MGRPMFTRPLNSNVLCHRDAVVALQTDDMGRLFGEILGPCVKIGIRRVVHNHDVGNLVGERPQLQLQSG